MQPLIKVRPYSLKRSKQSGVVLVIGMIAMVAMLAMAGLALDSGHMFINKTRLQNTADAAALHAAKVYDLTSDIALAQVAVTTAINLNGDMPGQKEMKDAIADGTITVSTQFSNMLAPFQPGTTPIRFIRVTMTNFRMPAFLARVVGVNTLTVAASAVAGPSPALDNNICDLAPMMLCGDPTPEDGTYWGYIEDDIEVIKQGAGVDCGTDDPKCVGPGNFQLVRLPGNIGGADIRVAAAGGYDLGCVGTSEPISTEPGNTVGPVVQGLNTRFGDYQGPVNSDDYPGDCNSDIVPTRGLKLNAGGDMIYSDTGQLYASGDDVDGDIGEYEAWYEVDGNVAACIANIPPDAPSPIHRRMMTVPVGDCSGTTNGQGEVPTLGFACVYLVQPVIQKGNEAHVYAQFRKTCSADGSFSMNPTTSTAPTRIILYKDPNRVDS